MSITKKQFDILTTIEASENKLTQRQIAAKLEISTGTVNKTVKELESNGLIENNAITSKGFEALEPYRVKRAVFIAAGFGSRLVPITLNTPKPLVRVKGKRIIDTLIDACIAAGINEIYIVRGYLAEQFDQLLYKYPMIKFLENPLYNEANNISSAFVARDLFQNAYVLEADLLVYNPKIITKYHYTSDVIGIYRDKTDDWCFEYDKDGFVKEEKIGGINCYQMIGIYYINSEDGKKLFHHIEEAYYSPGGKEKYWETVPNQVYKGQYKIYIRPSKETDVIEIDTFKELKAIDKTYDI
ncbi:MAG: winged helix-turn-helix transcriptional regulator [Clostridia bacterium]|nr:winged helix-turn-helix transcriptional regulator [Clostridia bacterium]